MSKSNKAQGGPLAYLFREEPLSEDSEILMSLRKFGFHCEVYADPRLFLVDLKKTSPAICILDFTAARIDLPTALLRTIRNFLGSMRSVLALVPPDSLELAGKLSAGEAMNWIEMPFVEAELALKLAPHIAPELLSQFVAAPAQTIATQSPSAPNPPPASGPEVSMRPSDSPAPATASAVRTAPASPPRNIPPVVAWTFQKIVPTLIQLGSYMEFHEDAERQLKFYESKLLPYRSSIIYMISQLRRTDDKLNLTQSLRAYGISKTCALVATMALANLTVPRSFGFDKKTGRPTFDPLNLVQYANQMTTHFGDSSRFYPVAFSSGLVYDLLAHLAPTMGERKSYILKLLESSFKAGLVHIDRGLKLGKQSEHLPLANHIISTIMMREAGKIVMAMYFEKYSAFRKYFDKKSISNTMQIVVEEKQFEVSHNLLGAILCQAAPNLSVAYEAVLFCDVPVPLRWPDSQKSESLAAFCRTL